MMNFVPEKCHKLCVYSNRRLTNAQIATTMKLKPHAYKAASHGIVLVRHSPKSVQRLFENIYRLLQIILP